MAAMEALARGEDAEVREANWNVGFHPSNQFVARMWQEKAEEWEAHFGAGETLAAVKAQMQEEQQRGKIIQPTPECIHHLDKCRTSNGRREEPKL